MRPLSVASFTSTQTDETVRPAGAAVHRSNAGSAVHADSWDSDSDAISADDSSESARRDSGVLPEHPFPDLEPNNSQVSFLLVTKDSMVDIVMSPTPIGVATLRSPMRLVTYEGVRSQCVCSFPLRCADITIDPSSPASSPGTAAATTRVSEPRHPTASNRNCEGDTTSTHPHDSKCHCGLSLLTSSREVRLLSTVFEQTERCTYSSVRSILQSQWVSTYSE